MVAYSYKRQFVSPIRVGLGILPVASTIVDAPGGYAIEPTVRPKRQTIRAIGKRRHARPGENLEHYCAMRTKGCFLIGRAICLDAVPITLFFGRPHTVVISGNERREISGAKPLNHFAQCDGFDCWASLVEFWRIEHGGPAEFAGVLITWQPPTKALNEMAPGDYANYFD